MALAACRLGLLFHHDPKIIGYGKKWVAEYFRFRNTALDKEKTKSYFVTKTHHFQKRIQRGCNWAFAPPSVNCNALGKMKF